MIELLLTLFYTSICVFLIYKLPFFKIDKLPSKYLVVLFGLKLISSILLTLLYTYYYPPETADIFRFFNDATPIYSALFENPIHYLKLISGYNNSDPALQQYLIKINNWTKQFDSRMFNDTQTIIRFNALIMIFSFGKFYVHTVFASFLSFVGLTALFKFFKHHFTSHSLILIGVVYLIPSVMFWSSGVLKECIVMFALGVFLYNIQQLALNKIWSIHLLYTLISLWLLSITKYYVLISLIPGAIAYFWHMKQNSFSVWKKYTIVFGSFILAFVIFEFVIKQISILELIALKQNDFIDFSASQNNVGSLIELTKLKPNLLSFLTVLPEAFINSFFRPFLWEIHSLIATIPALENVVFIILILLACMFPYKQKNDWNFILFSGSFIMLLFLISGFTTPVLGALVRYKIPGLPFLYLTVIYFIDIDTIRHSISTRFSN